ncbi:MAG: hypothetical protein AABY11_00870 [archaeon]
MEPVGAYVLLERAIALISNPLGTRNEGQVPGWTIAWPIVHPYKNYPFDLRHGPHIDEAMAFMDRFFAWSSAEVQGKQLALREEVAQWRTREALANRADSSPQMRDAARIIRRAIAEQRGGRRDPLAVKRIEHRLALVPDIRLARERARLIPTRANRQLLAALRRQAVPRLRLGGIR